MIYTTQKQPDKIKRTTNWYFGKTGGVPAYFQSIMDYQVAKAFSHITFSGADFGEIFSRIKKITDGHFESWIPRYGQRLPLLPRMWHLMRATKFKKPHSPCGPVEPMVSNS